MLLKTKGVELEVLQAGVFLRVGRKELWIERTGYKPKRLLEVLRDASGALQVFALGRALTIS